jgi:hypothetical protein
MPDRAAQPEDWKTEPLPAQHAEVPLNRAFSLDELARIKLGLIPEQMGDGWSVVGRASIGHHPDSEDDTQ